MLEKKGVTADVCKHGVPRVSAVDKSEQSLQKEQKQIEEYQELVENVNSRVCTIGKQRLSSFPADRFLQIASGDYSNDTLQLTSALLKWNPEYYTIWNHRRLLLQDVFVKELATNNTSRDDADIANAAKAGLTPAQQEILLIIREDLAFLVPLLRTFPKCYWIWNHRSWLLAQATERLTTVTALELWQGELGLVSKMLSYDSRNFHGWGYRRTVVQNLEQLSGKSMVEREFEYTTKMINTNLSNFSAWHNRSKLIPRLLDERHAGQQERKELFDGEFELITRALYTDPYDQSLWFYHQFLMATLVDISATTPSILQPISNANRTAYLEQEIDSIREMLDGAEDCKWIYLALLQCSQAYLDIEAGNKKVTTQEMSGWLAELRKLDPLREGRWRDLERSLKL